MTVTGISSFQEKMVELKAKRAGAMRLPNERQLSVTILGAGPAGLIRAIESVMDNHRTVVVERRAEDETNVNGRSNTVALNKDTMPILKGYGIYQWLLENGMIYPYDEEARPYLSVRLKDLESAMKAVLKNIAPAEDIIHYGSAVTQVNQARSKVAIQLQTGEWIRRIDILVNAEGVRSSTNQLLGIARQQVLAKVPVIAAIFEDTRPSITGICSFFAYIGETIFQTVVSVYYYAIFFFKFIFQGERFQNSDRIITGALILKTPGQNYLGCGFNKAHSEEFLALHQKVEQAREALEQEDTAKNRECLADAEDDYHSFANYWINLSFCRANFMALTIKFFKYFGCYKGPDVALESAARFPLKNFKMIEIGADRATSCQKKMRSSAYLICGDALATVDPTTGLGANTAIQTVSYFNNVMKGMKGNHGLDDLLGDYQRMSHNRVAFIHMESRTMRQLYRPDSF